MKRLDDALDDEIAAEVKAARVERRARQADQGAGADRPRSNGVEPSQGGTR